MDVFKKVKLTYFKDSGKYYTDEVIEISSHIGGWEALKEEIPKHHRIKTMHMLAQNADEDDNVKPYIVPHLYPPVKVKCSICEDGGRLVRHGNPDIGENYIEHSYCKCEEGDKQKSIDEFKFT